MPDSPSSPVTRIARHTREAIYVREANLVDDLIGKLTFTEMIYFQLMGRRPTAAQTRILDAVLVTLMEHGLTPSVIATRMVYDSCPEAIQAAVAAGLLAVGSTFVGTMEGCAALIEEIRAAPEGEAARARAIAERHRGAKLPLPGFGHPLHKPDDPRSPRLLQLAEDAGLAGNHIRALRALAAQVDSVYGRHITINATGAVAALLGEIEIPPAVMRGIAVVSRSAGLVGHIREEQLDPAARHMWRLIDEQLPYRADPAE
ncbi:MAG: citryl-CoA lyase [Betaproteobacteria bacterium]|nr:citryl-CoA lyase [Betaproteobacteria bacterium]